MLYGKILLHFTRLVEMYCFYILYVLIIFLIYVLCVKYRVLIKCFVFFFFLNYLILYSIRHDDIVDIQIVLIMNHSFF